MAIFKISQELNFAKGKTKEMSLLEKKKHWFLRFLFLFEQWSKEIVFTSAIIYWYVRHSRLLASKQQSKRLLPIEILKTSKFLFDKGAVFQSKLTSNH